MATNTYVALATQTLGSAVSSVTFSSIPQGYADLVLVANGLVSTNGYDFDIRVNGDTGTNYSYTALGGNGTSAASYRNSNATFMRFSTYSSWHTSTISTAIMHFQNYSNSSTYKTVIGRGNDTTYGVDATVGLWRSTSAITSITAVVQGANFTTGSTFTIYGIAAAAPFAAKATGGTISYTVDGYTYHKFTSSGTFTPLVSLTCDVLVVGAGGGGGSGGSYNGGGGSAGSVTYASAQTISSAQTVTIGGGGAGAYDGNSGASSSFGSTTAGGGAGGNHASNQGGYGAGGANSGGNGGPGVNTYSAFALYTSSGSGGYFAGGGGSASGPGSGGAGGGGNGSSTGTGDTAAANTGSGGGGGGYAAGSGASGIVIIRYAN